MSRLLKLITFDVTGTLMVQRPPISVKYIEAAKRFGVSVNNEDLMPIFKTQYKALDALHPNFGRDSGIGWEAWWTTIVVNVFKSAASHSDEDSLKKLASHLIEEYKTSRCWALSEGAIEILDLIKSRKIHMGVISNYDERLEMILKDLGIHSHFNFILTSYSVGVMKPDKKIFDFARAQGKEIVHPDNCMHIGNSMKYDYVGAKNAGWKPVYVGPLDENVKKLAPMSEVFQNLNELQQHLENVLNV